MDKYIANGTSATNKFISSQTLDFAYPSIEIYTPQYQDGGGIRKSAKDFSIDLWHAM